jgi:hypothetical protein
MRPRPATWAALLVSAVPVLSPRSGEVCCHPTAFPEERPFVVHSAGSGLANTRLANLGPQ